MKSSTPASDARAPAPAPPPPPPPDPVAIVAEWVLAGMRLSQIPDHVIKYAEKWPGPPPSPAELLDLIERAHATIEADSEIDPDRENAKAIARLNFLYSKSCAIQDYKGAAGVQKELNAIVAKVAAGRLLRAATADQAADHEGT